MNELRPIIERTAAILDEIHERLAMLEVGERDELAALRATIDELDRLLGGEEAGEVMRGLDAAAAFEEAEDTAPFESE